MIYPDNFPEERKNEFAEQKVFEQLKKLETKYDIFYSKKFVTDGIGKKPEFEIDFIIVDPARAILCLEVKGGLIHYDGAKDIWSQNGKTMNKRPDVQAGSACHSILKYFSSSISGMPTGWALCFPDCSLSSKKSMPSSLNGEQIIDQTGLLYIQDSLTSMFAFLKQQHTDRTGAKRYEYEKFKSQLLRSIGFVQKVGVRIKYDDQKFIELTEYQLNLFKRIAANKNIITSGPAGSGKTILAKAIAADFLDDGKTVLFLCFNRTIANKIRYDFDKNEDKLNVTTFHSLAKRIIEVYDPQWWNENKGNRTNDFWDLEVPIKMEEYIQFVKDKYDVLIVDEGQDFKEFWYELIFKFVPADGHKIIFLDAMQNIFGHFTEIPGKDGFINYELPENCRNTQNIVKELSSIINNSIKSFSKTPKGAEVLKRSFETGIEQELFLEKEIKKLLNKHDVESEQILILLNSKKENSCLFGRNKIAGLDLVALDNKARFRKECLHYTSIRTFKGLESDIVFVMDTQNIAETNKIETLYTEASRARHRLYLLNSTQ